MSELYWHIEGFDSQNKIFDSKIKAGHFSEKQIKALLMTLTAKAGLSFDEIIGAYARKRTKTANTLLHIHKSGEQPIYSCGDNPHFTARIRRSG